MPGCLILYALGSLDSKSFDTSLVFPNDFSQRFCFSQGLQNMLLMKRWTEQTQGKRNREEEERHKPACEQTDTGGVDLFMCEQPRKKQGLHIKVICK